MTSIITLKKSFKNPEYLDLALTHRSWVNENQNKRRSNERLEFLGDAILEFIVSRKIYEEFPNKEEGFLTALRANIVNTINLSQVAVKLKVGNSLYLSKGEEDGGGRENRSLLANTIEAIIGAIFVDRGISACEDFINENLLKDLSKIASKPLKDAKSRLQEMIQAEGFPAPAYEVIKEEGPDHSKIFTVVALINHKKTAIGQGKSKSEAEQKAAEKALKAYL